jgi:hypothetical protein
MKRLGVDNYVYGIVVNIAAMINYFSETTNALLVLVQLYKTFFFITNTDEEV